MNIREMQDEIIRLKKENDVCILAHAYTSHDVWEVADYVGDSFGLSQQAAKASNKTIIMCGVRFMAETVKILSPDKKVLLAAPEAGCPMADQIDADWLRQLKEENPGYTAVCYINTTSEL
ncbi:MAG: quinolinate synthase NadA, partial [Lachnospiraceae bacterium]|nr:quinolinate synthase NadA [Lachnospiraceae bacterium]